MQTVVIICDGGYRKLPCRPGVATYAWLCHGHGARESGVVCRGPCAGNLMAEYAAVVAALRWVKQAGLARGTQVDILTDCRFVADRLTGRCAVRRLRGLVMLHRAAVQGLALLRRRGYLVCIRHVDRKQVGPAHKLCFRAYSLGDARREPARLKAFLRAGGSRSKQAFRRSMEAMRNCSRS